MAIEIKELVVKVTVNDKPFPHAEKGTVLTPEIREQLIRECVEKVMDRIELKLER